MRITRKQLRRIVQEEILREQQYQPRPPSLGRAGDSRPVDPSGVGAGDELLDVQFNIPNQGGRPRLFTATASGVDAPGGFAYVYAKPVRIRSDHLANSYDPEEETGGLRRIVPAVGVSEDDIEIEITSFECVDPVAGTYRISCDYAYDVTLAGQDAASGDGTTTTTLSWAEMQALATALKRGEQFGKYEPPAPHNQHIGIKICVTAGTPRWISIRET